ncbi:hypothetical protein HMPREF1503_0513 [Olsenella uli MSTE5]|nr:hypothetical protein HMPREF1503_0513 [Olsenella uli MSTE5]
MVVLEMLISSSIELPQFLFEGINYQVETVCAVRSEENMVKHFPANLLYSFDNPRPASLIFFVM